MADLAESLRLLAEHAQALRAAGIMSFTVDGCSAVLAPSEPVLVALPKSDPDEPLDALDDPTTFGGAVPGFTRPKDDEEPDA